MRRRKQRGLLVRGVSRTIRILYRVVSLLALVMLFALVYLSRCGVPDCALRVAEQRANAAGIPIEIGKLTLTVRGWRAEDVRYSGDLLAGLSDGVTVDEVYLRWQRRCDEDGTKGWGIDVEASDIRLPPSAEFLAQAPAMSDWLRFSRIGGSLGIYSNRVVVSNATVECQATQLTVNGTLRRAGKHSKKSTPTRGDLSGLPLIAEYFDMIRLHSGSTVAIDFNIDPSDSTTTRLDLVVRLGYMTICGGNFSHAELAGHYLYPLVTVDRGALVQGARAAQVEGSYNFETGEVRGTLRNSIMSTNLLGLLPESIRDGVGKAGLQVASLPQFSITCDPVLPRDFSGSMSGTFSFDDVTYKGLVIESLHGDLAYDGERIEFKHLEGTVAGQGSQAERVGSCMQGGSAKGEVFWDMNSRSFGVEAEMGFDPRLLVGPLSRVAIATNIIQQFSFRDQAPSAHVSLGASVTNWSSFYLNLQIAAKEATARGSALTSVDVTADYKQRRLVLDPLVVEQGDRFTTGSVALDFHDSTVAFDVESSMDPAEIESFLGLGLNLFGNHIKTSGDTRVTAAGTFDWGSMQKTDFFANVQVDRVEIPVCAVDQFQCTIIGKEAEIAMEHMACEPYGGKGDGRFAMTWRPGVRALPYEVDVTFSDVDAGACLQFLAPGESKDIAGNLSGRLDLEADMSADFFATAKGAGALEIRRGKLSDFHLFSGLLSFVKSTVTSLDLFSISSVKGEFAIADGSISSDGVFIDGNLIHAKAWGRYSMDEGFDALVEVKALRNGILRKVVDVATSPFAKLFVISLTGPMDDPAWELARFHSD